MTAATRAPAASARLTGVAAAVLVASAIATVAWCRSMPAMDMPMPGGWTMSMAWMRMPGQTWAAAAASFMAMWVVMMPAMMLPACLPALRRCAQLAAAEDGAIVRAVVLAALGYFSVWAVAGLAVYPIGAAAAAAAMTGPDVARRVPLAIGAVLLLAGAWQLTGAKARALACCHEDARAVHAASATPRSAWRHGVALGVRCLRCCSNLMIVLLVIGVMDLLAMTAVTAAIAAERLAPDGPRVAKAVGVAIMGGAIVVVARALQP